MYLIQILLPLTDNEGRRFNNLDYDLVRKELTAQFGGITSFFRAPAEGTWKEGSHTTHDKLVVYEVMTGHLDHVWWENYRAILEQRFRQETLIVRALKIEML